MVRLVPMPDSNQPGPAGDGATHDGLLGPVGQRAWGEALQRGYLVMGHDLALAEERSNLVELWSWHCTAPGNPVLVVDLGMGPESPCWILLDLSPARRVFRFTALDAICRAVRAHATSAGRWLVASDTVELDRITAAPDDLAAALLAVALDDRYTVPEDEAPHPFARRLV